MSRYRRSNTDGATFFFTVVTHRRQPILTDEPLRAALRAAILRVRERYPFTIDAWVLLPDHLHTIWTLPPGDADFGLRWGWIKRLLTRTVAADYERAEWRNASRHGANRLSGNSVSGSIKSVMRMTSGITWITCISIR